MAWKINKVGTGVCVGGVGTNVVLNEGIMSTAMETVRVIGSIYNLELILSFEVILWALVDMRPNCLIAEELKKNIYDCACFNWSFQLLLTSFMTVNWIQIGNCM